MNSSEPNPIPNGNIAVWEVVVRDMNERNLIGIQRYNTPLQPFNGRNALIDAYQESLDLAVYLRQRILEDELSKDETSDIKAYLVKLVTYLESKNSPIGTQPIIIQINDSKADEIISLIKNLK